MQDHPSIKPGDWIVVGSTRCVVATVKEPDSPFGVCEVVCSPSKPANRDVEWTDGAWAFVKSGDFGGYADKNPRLAPFVRILKNG